MSKRPRNASVQLVVVGSLALDTVETPRSTAREVLGGSVSYACAAASFFTRVGMVAVAGDDFPARGRALFRRLGINLEGLQSARGRTFRWAGRYETDMNDRRTLATELNVFESFAPSLPPAYREAPLFLLGNISPELQLRVLDQARAPRLVAADTMDLWIRTARPALDRVVKRVDVLLLNDGEARLLTGEANLARAARAILGAGPEYVVVKKGEHGATLYGRRGVRVIPPYPVENVRDPTGAGDSFAGAALGALAGAPRISMDTLAASLLSGSAVAAFGVEDFSLRRLARLRPAEIRKRYRELRAMMGGRP